jgi:hypothetical protein
MVHYPNSSADPETLWQNPANFNNSNGPVCGYTGEQHDAAAGLIYFCF